MPDHDRERLACSFCGKTQKAVAKLIAGPGAYICDEDVARAREGAQPVGADAKCGFCGKTGGDVRSMWGSDPRICDECIDLCIKIIRGEGVEETLRSQKVEIEARSVATIQAQPGPNCPSCRAPLEETLRAKAFDVPDAEGGPSARLLFIYCSACGQTIDDVILPDA